MLFFILEWGHRSACSLPFFGFRFPFSQGQVDVDSGLNALSRGLEANQTSSDLWLQYLRLYAQREDRSDLAELSQQALQFAPSYALYWEVGTRERR